MKRGTLWAVCLILLLAQRGAAADPTVYVHNAPVPRPSNYAQGDLYVPAPTLLALFKPSLTRVAVDQGTIRLNGTATVLKPWLHGTEPWYPVLATAKWLHWDVVNQSSLGMVDVVLPRSMRAVEADRAPQVPLDPGEEAIAKRLTRKSIEQFGLNEDPAITQRVQRIGERLAKAAGRPFITYQFYVANTDTYNAWSTGGGRIFITLGLLKNLTDSELAGVMGHEIAHDCLRHISRKLDAMNEAIGDHRRALEAHARQRTIIASGGSEQSLDYQEAVQEEQEFTQKANEAINRINHWATNDQWDEEKEADRMGMIYAYNAGFDPLGMLYALQKLQKLPLPPVVESLSDHPPLAQRIELAQKVYDTYFRNRTPR